MDEQPELVFKDDLESLRQLNPRQVIFIAEYLATNNVAEASRRAGYKNPQHGLLKVPEVIEIIARSRQEKLKKLEVSEENVLARLAAMAFTDPRGLFREDGTPKPISELDDNVAALIAGLEVNDLFEGRGEGREYVGQLKKYRLVDPVRCLELLGRYLKMWTDKMEVTGVDALAERLQKARQNTQGETK